eukprot:sb/3476541/
MICENQVNVNIDLSRLCWYTGIDRVPLTVLYRGTESRKTKRNNYFTSDWTNVSMALTPSPSAINEAISPGSQAPLSRNYNKVIKLYLGRYTCFIATLTGNESSGDKLEMKMNYNSC